MTTPTRSLLMNRYDVSANAADVLAEYRFDADRFDLLRAQLLHPDAGPHLNWIEGPLVEPTPQDLRRLPPVGSAERLDVTERGVAALQRGEVVVVVLAGGMATRFGGGVKALADVLPGRRFLDVRVADLMRSMRRHGAVIPMVLMSSFQSDQALGEAVAPFVDQGMSITLAPQSVALRLTPDGDLYRDGDGEISLYAPGHGDLPEALISSGVLARLAGEGIRHVMVSNVDNVAATVDPAVIGVHLDAGTPMTCEVTGGDLKGGAPYRVGGHLQIVEEFRIPPHLDLSPPAAVNTNSMIIDLDVLTTSHPLTWFAVDKLVAGAPVVQFERLVGELSSFVPTSMLVVDRDGPDGRFQPVKDPAELARRQPSIRQILAARGILDEG